MNNLSDDTLLEILRSRLLDYKAALGELERLNVELRTTNKKLEESESLKSHFISNITNEIVNPFASILGLSKTILSVDKEGWKKVISMVSLIHSEAFNLDFQFKNIFVAAKIEAGELVPEIANVEIICLINSTIDSFKTEAKKKMLEFSFQFFPTKLNGSKVYFKTDPEKLKLILSNLISNAVKFSYERNKIEVSALLENKLLKISVRDYGAGISESNQLIIFDRFKRLDSGINSINRGHGLGLSVNKALLDILKGEIAVETKLNEGALFQIILPEFDLEATGFSSEGNETFFEDEEIY